LEGWKKDEDDIRCWSDGGQLEIKCFWKNGKEEGEELWWYENGQLERKRFWEDGKEVDERMWRKLVIKPKITQAQLKKKYNYSGPYLLDKDGFVVIVFVE
jgi:antitoxin component YwqK of YwqJK toxin-antitoxin module